MTADLNVAAAIEEMVRRLVERFEPLQVVLFGSHARGEATPESDVDLLLVVPESRRSAALEREALEAARGVGVSVDVVVRTPEQVWRECRVPGSVVKNALREGTVVYEHDERPDAALELLRRARVDAEDALLLSRGGSRGNVCFLAQQAAEKAIKAALVFASVDYPRTHELDPLIALLPDDWPLKHEYPDLRWLTRWAVAGRYAGVDPTAEEAEAALATARAILEAAVRDLRGHGLELDDGGSPA